uniref:Metallo-beta-lactamase domain-containing protein n=1 Tax=Candidozyma auris TaxID=498019 RepID=A0A0L0P4G4_CANAR
MNKPPRSLRLKSALGLLVGYTSFEAYMHLRTQHIIRARKKEHEAAIELEDVSKFKSATINGMFVNPFDEYRPQTGFEFLWVRLLELVESFYGNKIEIHDKYPTPEGDFKEVDDMLKTFRPNYELLRENSKILQQCTALGNFDKLREKKNGVSLHDQLLFTWLGQSCSLVQISGINILTDPIFSDHLFTPHFGPKRLVKSPMTLSDVNYATNNKLDFVLVSHNHPDHLDLDAVERISNRATWIVPLGLKLVLAKRGIYRVVELDWWDKVSLNKLICESPNFKDDYEIVCVPAMHWSGRHITDSNQSLWGSFILRRNGHSLLYHAGDTGFCRELFEMIAKLYGPVTLLMLPIGQYCPEWHQLPRHILPEESIKIAQILQTKFALGIHFGTFKLSSEPILEPKNKLLDLAKHIGKANDYKVPEFGLTYSYHLHNGDHLKHF